MSLAVKPVICSEKLMESGMESSFVSPSASLELSVGSGGVVS